LDLKTGILCNLYEEPAPVTYGNIPNWPVRGLSAARYPISPTPTSFVWHNTNIALEGIGTTLVLRIPLDIQVHVRLEQSHL
jgi:hypothetical protein